MYLNHTKLYFFRYAILFGLFEGVQHLSGYFQRGAATICCDTCLLLFFELIFLPLTAAFYYELLGVELWLKERGHPIPFVSIECPTWKGTDAKEYVFKMAQTLFFQLGFSSVVLVIIAITAG